MPSGRLHTTARIEDGRVASVRFRNVPSFVHARGLEAAGRTVDVAFGGAFYASLEERVEPGELPRLIELGREIKRDLEREHEIVHPHEPELRDVYGVIFWQEEGEDPLTQRNVTVFADGEVDRSPCGSGTSARLALLHDEGRLAIGEPLRHLSIVGSEFTGRVVEETPGGVVTEVEGSAHRTGPPRVRARPARRARRGLPPPLTVESLRPKVSETASGVRAGREPERTRLRVAAIVDRRCPSSRARARGGGVVRFAACFRSS